nr:phospholysine phosphohistidine inorganic pyrophosphate phosphatase isoform X2 [Kogia breviceps]
MKVLPVLFNFCYFYSCLLVPICLALIFREDDTLSTDLQVKRLPFWGRVSREPGSITCLAGFAPGHAPPAQLSPAPPRPQDYTSQAPLRGERGRSFQQPVGTRGPRRRRDVMAAWGERLAGVRGVLLDISGVLYDGGEGGGAPIAGSVEALARLKRSQLKVRFCTNESQKSRGDLVGTLRRLGFDISEGEVTAPAPATCLILKERGLRPHLLIHDGVRSEFDQIDTSNPNCVVIGDAGEGFSYQNMNKAFQVLMELENPVLFSLGKGRFYKETSGLMLDVGPYTKALEYACGIEAEVVGKPSPAFFKSALREMGVEAHQAVMIGDDIVGDVSGAQRCGMRALQVRTGKFRPSDEHCLQVKADGYVDNLAEAVDLLLQHAHK